MVIRITEASKRTAIAMIKLLILLFQSCTIALIAVQLLVPIFAHKKTSNMDEFTVENQKTRMRQNYVVQRAFNDMDNDVIEIDYITEPTRKNPEELPAFIVDYANMIRNDIILLDNSVETRTRKRGKYNPPEVQSDVPCSCEQERKEAIILGEGFIPRSLETRICNTMLCPSPYGCYSRLHNITVMKRKAEDDETSEELPKELQKRWVTVKRPVTVGCMCLRESTGFN